MNTYLASRYEPFNGSLTEVCIGIRYNYVVGGNLLEVSVKTCLLRVQHCGCCFAFLDILR